MRLEGTVIVVTGGSSGLGKEMARAFVAEGADVVVAARDDDRRARAVADLGNGPGTATGIRTDVRSWDSVQALVARTREEVGAVDVLVNNAGVSQSNLRADHDPQLLVDTPVDVWDAVVGTNLRGVFLCAKAVLPGMLERDAGRLVHVSSGHGLSGRRRRGAYVASKFGLEGFAETLALELADTGVRSFLLRPGGGTYTERRGELGRGPETFTHADPSRIAGPAVSLVAGEGDNGGRYVVTDGDDGVGYRTYSRGESEEFHGDETQ